MVGSDLRSSSLMPVRPVKFIHPLIAVVGINVLSDNTVVGQVIFSLWLYFYGKGRVPSDLRKLLWKMHNLQGYFSYLLNFIVIGLGLWSNWATKVLGENAQFALAAGLVIISLLSIYDKVFRKKIKREKKVKEKDAKEKDVGKKGN
jgi:hypothetical protein